MGLPSTSRPFPGFENLFHLRDPVADRPYRGRIGVGGRQDFAFTRAEALPARAVMVTHAMGEALPRDVIWTTMAVPVVVSQRFIDILLDQRFTGWSTYPVEVYSKSGDLLPGYHGLSITGRCGLIEPGRSGIVLEHLPGGWIPRFKGLFFDPASWDGSDFFAETPDPVTGGSGHKFITSEVWIALRKAKVRNVRFERLSEEEMSTSIYEIGHEHRLPPDYKERLAQVYRTADVPIPEDYADLLS